MDISKKEFIDRKEFLKLSGTVLAGTALSRILDYEITKVPEPLLSPKNIHGVEVYGLNETISTEQQVIDHYKYLDRKYVSENNLSFVHLIDKLRGRKESLDPNERYLEVIVKRSAYDSFLERQKETGADFVEWIKMHVDTMNMCMENAKPSSSMRAVLRRIMVIDDDLTKDFWDERAYGEEGRAGLSTIWGIWYYSNRPLDTDAFWVITDDYRVDTAKERERGWYFSFRHENDKTIFDLPPRRPENYNTTYEFPYQNNSLKGKSDIWLDFWLIHEWSHWLMSLPDEYHFDVYKLHQRFQYFLFDTESFHVPYLSPYLSYYSKRNIDLKMRDFLSALPDFSDKPDHNSVTVKVKGETIKNFNIQPVERKRSEDRKSVTYHTSAESREYPNSENVVVLSESIFKAESNTFLIRTRKTKGVPMALFLPKACFNMSKIAGLEKADYVVDFTGFDDPSKKKQILKLVDESDMPKFIKDHENAGDFPYAKMKVDGTSTWFVWFLRD